MGRTNEPDAKNGKATCHRRSRGRDGGGGVTALNKGCIQSRLKRPGVFTQTASPWHVERMIVSPAEEEDLVSLRPGEGSSGTPKTW